MMSSSVRAVLVLLLALQATAASTPNFDFFGDKVQHRHEITRYM